MLNITIIKEMGIKTTMFCMCQNGCYQKQTMSVSKDAEETETFAP